MIIEPFFYRFISFFQIKDFQKPIFSTKNRISFLIYFLLICVSTPPIANASNTPVFPSAEGFGIYTPAGRGGEVYRVTNLNPSGNGSLRAALQASGPRVVIFEVSGTIAITEDLVIMNPFITIAGQTSPSPGITIKGAGLWIATHDVLVQHLRIRVGNYQQLNYNT